MLSFLRLTIKDIEKRVEPFANYLTDENNSFLRDKTEIIIHFLSENGAYGYFSLLEVLKRENPNFISKMIPFLLFWIIVFFIFVIHLGCFARALTVSLLLFLHFTPKPYVMILTPIIYLIARLLVSNSVLNYVANHFETQPPVPQLIFFSDEDQIAESKHVSGYVNRQRELGRDITVVFVVV